MSYETPDTPFESLQRLVDQATTPLQSSVDLTQNRYSSLHLHLLNLGTSPKIMFGLVVQALPHVGWYKVQVGGAGGDLTCRHLAETGFMPVGVRSTHVLPPGTRVWLIHDPFDRRGYILGAIPELVTDPRRSLPDFLVQGGGSGLLREAVHHGILTHTARYGGVENYSSGRPLDSTTLDWGKMAETGVGILIDPFQAYLRVNEVCGLFLNYFDSYARLAGWNFDLQTAAHELSARLDEGELQLYEGVALYPWEALGLFEPGQPLGQEFPARDVQKKLHRAAIDLSDEEEQIEPFYRVERWGGYLGQGGRRTVSVPATLSGRNTYDAADPPIGVFEESIGTEGAYLLRSAHSIVIAKEALIPIPKRRKLPEDPSGDSRQNGYEPGRAADVGVEDDHGSLNVAAGLPDLAAYETNYRHLHPFQHHEQDFETPQESEHPWGRSQEQLDFGALAEEDVMPASEEQVRVSVDHKTGEVTFILRRSRIVMPQNGDVYITNGCGSEIRLMGADIELGCAGNIRLRSGLGTYVLAGDDFVARAKKSIDLSATEGDVRAKAEGNMQLLAGNSGKGGLLLESKGEGVDQDFREKTGEEVESAGVILRATKSQVAALANQVYARTVGDDGSQPGNIVLDAGQGNSQIDVYAAQANNYLQSSLNVYFGPQGEETPVQAAASINATHSELPGGLSLHGALVVEGGSGIAVDGSISQRNGSIVNDSGGEIGRHSGISRSQLDTSMLEAQANQQRLTQSGQQQHDAFKEEHYGANRIGNSDVIEQASFSFRDGIDDAKSTEQYRTENFRLVEDRWQQMVRTGEASGGTVWEERPVRYQNQELYPYPGRKKLTQDAAFLEAAEFRLYEAAQGRAKDRTDGAYQEPELGQVTPAKLNESYKTIL